MHEAPTQQTHRFNCIVIFSSDAMYSTNLTGLRISWMQFKTCGKEQIYDNVSYNGNSSINYE